MQQESTNPASQDNLKENQIRNMFRSYGAPWLWDNSTRFDSFSDDEEPDGRMLKVTIQEGCDQDIARCFQISSQGLVSNNAQVQECFVFFGSQGLEDDKVINDVVIQCQDNCVGKRQFYIQYDKQLQDYFFKSFEERLGTFTEIQFPIRLESGNVVQFGPNIIGINISDDGFQISLHFLEGPKANSAYHFDSRRKTGISFGRLDFCEFIFEDNYLSRYQCLIFYNQGWRIVDGDGRRSSTNGTWLFKSDLQRVYDGMNIKVGHYLFNVKVFT